MAVYALNWPLVRLVAWVKRLTKATESANLQRERIALALERLAGPMPLPHDRKPTEIHAATVEELNKKWREDHPFDAEGTPI